MSGREAVAGIIRAELAEPVPDAVAGFAADLAARLPGTAAILYYGSNLRTGDLTASLLDFYVIVDDYSAALGGGPAAWANRLLPPNVYYAERTSPDGERLRAKFAVLSVAHLAARCRPVTLDVSIWARFAQPVRCVWVRDGQAQEACVTALTQAVETAFASVEGGRSPLDHWSEVFARTYRCELRAERAGKGADLVGANAQRFVLISTGMQPARRSMAGWWQRRRWAGRAQHVARLIKAAFTFVGGIDYLAWKISRHSGVPVVVTPWQRRHPILGGAGMLFSLLRRGAIR